MDDVVSKLRDKKSKLDKDLAGKEAKLSEVHTQVYEGLGGLRRSIAEVERIGYINFSS